jgi:hypothetical protein
MVCAGVGTAQASSSPAGAGHPTALRSTSEQSIPAPHTGLSQAGRTLLQRAVSTPKVAPAHTSKLSSVRGNGHYANQQSTNWSGYAADSGTYTSVSSSWTQPTVSCTSDGIVAFWIGLDGWGSSTVEQDGTGVDCTSGSPQYFAWWETYPANDIQEYGDYVAPGDSLTSTVTDEGGGTYDMVLTDNTQGWTENNPVSASGSDASAEIIAEAVTSGSSVTPLPDFGSINFTGSQIDGSTMENSGAQAIDMIDSNGNVIASTGASDGQGDFTVTYTGSSSDISRYRPADQPQTQPAIKE